MTPFELCFLLDSKIRTLKDDVRNNAPEGPDLYGAIEHLELARYFIHRSFVAEMEKAK